MFASKLRAFFGAFEHAIGGHELSAVRDDEFARAADEFGVGIVSRQEKIARLERIIEAAGEAATDDEFEGFLVEKGAIDFRQALAPIPVCNTLSSVCRPPIRRRKSPLSLGCAKVTAIIRKKSAWFGENDFEMNRFVRRYRWCGFSRRWRRPKRAQGFAELRLRRSRDKDEDADPIFVRQSLCSGTAGGARGRDDFLRRFILFLSRDRQHHWRRREGGCRQQLGGRFLEGTLQAGADRGFPGLLHLGRWFVHAKDEKETDGHVQKHQDRASGGDLAAAHACPRDRYRVARRVLQAAMDLAGGDELALQFRIVN